MNDLMQKVKSGDWSVEYLDSGYIELTTDVLNQGNDYIQIYFTMPEEDEPYEITDDGEYCDDDSNTFYAENYEQFIRVINVLIDIAKSYGIGGAQNAN